MGLLASANYDPEASVSKSCEALLAMTAIDTTNLRLKFVMPPNGFVRVRLKGQTHGATTPPRILLGVMEGATVKGRGSPFGSSQGSTEKAQMGQEVIFLVSGTPGTEYTWDAAYSVDIVAASTGLKYGGVNDASGNDAFGAFTFEVWEATNLLAGTFYDPTTAAAKSATALLAMTALDTTNLRLTFKAPSSGKVLWRIGTQTHSATGAVFGTLLLGVLESTTLKGRVAPVFGNPAGNLATSCMALEAMYIVTGLEAGKEYTWDAAYAVQVVAGGGGIKHGGPNNTTTNDAFGGTAFEIYTSEANPLGLGMMI